MQYTIYFAGVIFSYDFQELQKPVERIDENYINDWSNTDFDGRITFYEISNLEEIYAELSNSAHNDGKKLVRITIIIDNYFL